MIAGVKKCIDAGDIKGLRYIFLDSLDVDPTFEKYKDDYAVCKKIEGMFEPYTELTDLSTIHSEWNMDYWVKLKYDQKQNFSEKRFEHMIEVAKVVNAEKVERLLVERAAKQSKVEEQIEQVIPKESTQAIKTQQSKSANLQPTQSMQQVIQSKPKAQVEDVNTKSDGSISESEQVRISEGRRDIDLHNQRIEQERLENERKRAERAREIERQNALVESQNQPKKAMGIVVVAVVIILIVVVVLLLKVL